MVRSAIVQLQFQSGSDRTNGVVQSYFQPVPLPAVIHENADLTVQISDDHIGPAIVIEVRDDRRYAEIPVLNQSTFFYRTEMAICLLLQKITRI